MNCNKDCCSMIDDLLEQIQNGLGRVDYNKIDEYIDEKIQEIQDAIESGDLTPEVNWEDLLVKIKDALAKGNIEISADQVSYNNTNVADALDELKKKSAKLVGTIGKLRQFTKGETVYNVPVKFSFNKELKSLTMHLYVNDMESSTIELDPKARVFEIPKLNATTQILLEAVATDDDRVTLETEANFALKYYVGCCGASRISNKETLALTGYHALPDVNRYTYTFHAIGPQYMWWAFPVDLHKDYDFFNNGMHDSNYVWTTNNLTNEYGYTETYLFIRSGNPHTSSNIYTEVIAHEH